MKNNIFNEQQENAFYEHDFEHFTVKDLEQMVNKYKAKNGKTEFPSPDCIFYKRFTFLSKPLAALQAKTQSESKAKVVTEAEVQKKKAQPLTPQKAEPKKKENGTPQAVIRNTVIALPSQAKTITKLGVLLEDNTDTDPFIIPPIFNEIIKNVLSGKKLVNEKDIELVIETTPISRDELKEETKWVNDLISSDNESPQNTNRKKIKDCCNAIQSPILSSYFENMDSPVLLHIKD